MINKIKKMRVVLIIDSDEGVRSSLEDIFEEEIGGFSVLKAYDGLEGVKLAKENPIDLVILSLFIDSSLKGDKIIEQVKKYHPGVKVAIFSGLTLDGPWTSPYEIEAAERIKQLGFDAYKVKPSDPLEIIQMVKELFEDKSGF